MKIRHVFKVLLLGATLLGTLHVAGAQVRLALASEAPAALSAGDRFVATLTVEIAEGWHISSITQPDGGPVRTGIAVPDKQPVRLAGAIMAPKPRKEHSTAFDIDVETYEDTVIFKLPLTATETIKAGAVLKIEVSYQACNQETCLMPMTETLTVPILPVALSMDQAGSRK